MKRLLLQGTYYAREHIPFDPSMAFRRRWLDTVKLEYNPCRPDGHLKLTVIALNRLKPVCQQSHLQGPLLRRTRRFFASGGRNHRQYSLTCLDQYFCSICENLVKLLKHCGPRDFVKYCPAPRPSSM